MTALSGNRSFTRKRRRLVLLLLALSALALGGFLVFRALDEAMLYFRLPSEVAAEMPPAGKRFRLGGLVAEHSFERLADGKSVRFRVTDGKADLPVRYTGILPDLFREGQGVIADGAFDEKGLFVADMVLAKHDETYMPREVYEKIQALGHPGEAERP
ncbi:MAG: hypothetical protein Tsb008_04710 [Rhodothalassiaceae bacterium]